MNTDWIETGVFLTEAQVRQVAWGYPEGLIAEFQRMYSMPPESGIRIMDGQFFLPPKDQRRHSDKGE